MVAPELSPPPQQAEPVPAGSPPTILPTSPVPRPAITRFYVAVTADSSTLSWQLRATSGAVLGRSSATFGDLAHAEEAAWRVRELARHGGAVLDAEEVPSTGGWVWRVTDQGEVVAVDSGAGAHRRDAIRRGRGFLAQASGATVSRVMRIHRGGGDGRVTT